MNISDKMLDEFVLIYKDEFGEEICRKQALEMASRLLMLYVRLAKTLPTKPAKRPVHARQRPGDRRPVGFRT